MKIYHREKLEKDLSLLQDVDFEDDQAFREDLFELEAAAIKHLK